MVAGAVSKLKCSSGIFISFWDHHEKSFQWFRFCEKKSAVVLFFLEAVEEAHLWSISEKRRGQGMGGHSIQAGQNLGWRQEDWSEGGRMIWMGPQPSGNESLPCPGQHEAILSLRPGNAGLGRQSLGLLHLALEPRGLSFIFPGCLLILDPHARTFFRPRSVEST